MDIKQQLDNLRADYHRLGQKITNLPATITQAETDRLVGERQELAQRISQLEQQAQQ